MTPTQLKESSMLISVRTLLVPTCFIALGLLLWPSPAAAGRKDDVILMKNGDRLTGEIKKMEDGQIYIDTGYTVKAIPVDWLQVEKVESKAVYRIELTNGNRLTGVITKVPAQAAAEKDFRIQSGGEERYFPASEVVGILSQEPNFWHQLRGSINLGSSFASGSPGQMNVSATATYHSTKYQVTGSVNSTLSGSSNGEKTNRHELTLNPQLYLSRNSYLASYIDFLTSSQQSLDLRTTLGGGFGRYMIRSNTKSFAWLGGLVYTKEKYAPSSGLTPRQNNVEGLFGLGFNWSRFNYFDWKTTFLVFPSITQAGRIRTNLNHTFSVKLPNNLTLNFDIWDTFDSQPPPNARKNDLGISTSFGWTF
jgi:putative salt-induced outer membrane protein YdiY